MADMSAMHDKITKMAGMMGASPDTVSKMKGEMAAKAASVPSATVIVAVKKPDAQSGSDYEDLLMKLSDADIAKMTEQQAKDFLTKARDACVAEEKSEGEDEGSDDEIASAPKKSNLQDALSKAGGMY